MTAASRPRFKAHNYANAGLFKRLAAMFYDSLLIVAVWMLVGYLAIALNAGEAVEGPWFTSLLFVVTYGFFAFFWLRSGQTLGMTAWRLRIEDSQGHVITPRQSLLRFMGALLSALALGLGYWVILFNRDKLTWHDRWSDTRVVQLPKSS